MAEQEQRFMCDLTGDLISEGEEISVYVDYKGARKTFHFSLQAMKSGDVASVIAIHLPEEEDDAEKDSEQG